MSRMFKKSAVLFFLSFFLFMGFQVGGVLATGSPAPGGTATPVVATTVVGFGTNPLCGLKTNCTPAFIVGRVIQIVLGIVGTVALVMFVYGGALWMVSAGESDKMKTARDILLWTSLGLVAIFVSYIALNFVVSQITNSAALPPPSAPGN